MIRFYSRFLICLDYLKLNKVEKKSGYLNKGSRENEQVGEEVNIYIFIEKL